MHRFHRGVQLDDTYDRAVLSVTGDDYSAQVARGNLCLLQGRLTMARTCFEQAYKIADDAQLSEATESLARLIKAEDAATGRAAAWLAAQTSKRPATRTSGE